MSILVDFGAPVSDSCEATGAYFGMDSSRIAGGVSHKASLHDFTFTKSPDSFSSVLIQHCSTGSVFARVTIELYNDRGICSVKYRLGDVSISAVVPGARGDSVGLIFATVKQKYYGE